MALVKYGSDNSSLWTPFQTGSYPLTTTTLCAWIDGEDSDQMTLSPIADAGSGSQQITQLVDKGVGSVTFSQESGFQVPNFSNGTGSFLINNRNSIYFWESSLQDNPDCTLTAPIGAFDGILPAGDEERLVYMVFQAIEHRPLLSANFIYSYGTADPDRLFSLAIWATGSSTTSPQAFYIHYNNLYDNPYYEQPGPVRLYSTPGTPQFITQHHVSGNGTLSDDNNQTEYTYSRTLSTANTNTEFWLTEQVGGGGRGIRMLFGELLILDSTVGENDRQRIEGYLAHKWSLTDSLASDHPYKSSAPTNGSIGGGGGGSFPNPQEQVASQRFSNKFVDQALSQLPLQYDRSTSNQSFVPLRLSVRGPSNLRLRPADKVYKVTKG